MSDFDNCYVLWIDILGFSDLVKKKSSKDILDIITRFLGCLEGIKAEDNISCIYFSDSAIVWQKNPSKKGEDFLDFSSASVLMCSNLLANNIPCRGAIAYGPLTVTRDISDKYDIFFGDALIEAYKAEVMENWIGVTVCPSAVEHIESNFVDQYSGGHFVKRDDNCLLLNPCCTVQHAYTSTPREILDAGLEWVETFPYRFIFMMELLAFKFIVTKAKKFADKCDFSGRVASKYHTTLSFLRKVLPTGCFDWAKKISEFVEMKDCEPKIVNQ
jgi:hypothetical protein